MRYVIPIVALALSAAAGAAGAQRDGQPELRPFAGVAIQGGAQRARFDDAMLFGVQGAVQVVANLHLTTTLSWSPGRTSWVTTRRGVDVFQYDLGMELYRPLGRRLNPFATLGAGARTYAYETGLLQDHTCTAGYFGLGTEVTFGRSALRLEGRNNMYCFRPPLGDTQRQTRHDVDAMLGFAYHFR